MSMQTKKRSFPRILSIGGIGILVTLGLAGCDKSVLEKVPGFSGKPALKTDQEKSSYALGQLIGQDMKNKGVDLNMKIFAQSMESALQGKENQLSQEDMQKALMSLREVSQKKMMAQKEQDDKKDAAEAEKNLVEAKAFLEKNKSAEGVKTTATGLQYKISDAGKGTGPKATSVVSVHYRGSLINGQEFDKSGEQPVEFPLNQVIPAWTEGLQLLKPGGKMTLYVPPELGYGARRMDKIPPNSVLVFDVELKEVKTTKK